MSADNTALLNRRLLGADENRFATLELYGGKRDMHSTLGYDDSLTINQYWNLYARADIAKAVVDKPPKATWKNDVTVHAADARPDADDDSIREDFEELKRKQGILRDIQRADIVSRIGRHGVMVLGVNDGRSLEQPLGEATELKYVTPMSERRIQDFALGENPTSERYNQPVMWQLDFEDEEAKPVHWTRVIHIAEQKREHAIYQIPPLQPIYNRIMDWQKVIGGASEMFWRGADRKVVANLDPDAGKLQDEEELETQVEEMRHGLRDTVYARGLSLDSIDGEDVDPRGVKEVILDAIASETGIPKRILVGSESGELASTQDRANFYGNIEDRRRNHAGPEILHPFVDRLQRAGIITEGDFAIHWPELFVLDEMERAEIQAKKARAISNLNDAEWLDEDEKRELMGL